MMFGAIVCEDTRECFAQNTDRDGIKRCMILRSGYPGNDCPFCKPKRDAKAPTKEEMQRVRQAKRRAAAQELE